MKQLSYPCPICHSVTSKLITEKLRRGVGKVYLCDHCDHAFLAQEAKMDSKQYYAEEYRKEFSHKASGDATNALEIFETYKKYQQYRLRPIEAFLGKDKTLLELGASSGQFLVNVRDQLKEVHAIELDRACCDFMKSKLEIIADSEPLENSKFRGNKYDIVCSFQVLEHIESPVTFLQEVRGAMKDGGISFIEVPNHADALLSIWGSESYKDFYYHSAHLHYFTKKSLTKVALDAGFENKNISFVFLQDYNVLNHINWITNDRPQATCDVGLSEVSLSAKDGDVSMWLTSELRKVNQEYEKKITEKEATSNVMMILKK